MAVVPLRVMAPLCISSVSHVFPDRAPGFHLHGAVSSTSMCSPELGNIRSDKTEGIQRGALLFSVQLDLAFPTLLFPPCSQFMWYPELVIISLWQCPA